MLRTAILFALSLPCFLAFQSPSVSFGRVSQNVASARRPLALRMGCPLVPLGSNVIVTLEKAANAETKSASGILIAATVKSEGPKTGVVAAVGDGWHTDQGTKVAITEVKVGDKVMFREPTAFENRKMKIDEEEYFVISVNDVLAKITK